MGDLLLHPALPLLVAAVLAWWAPPRLGRVLLVLAPLVALAQLSQLGTSTTAAATYLDFELTVLRADGLALAFAWVFAIAAVIAGTFGLSTVHARERTSVLAYAGAAMVVVLAGDLLTFFVAWEVKAIAGTFVVLSRRGGNSDRAGMRYLYAHLVGGTVLLAGILWHVAATGSLAFAAFDVSAATVLILVGCALSAAVPPLHAWLPDAYPEASVAGTVFLSAYTTKAAVYALARGFAGWEVLVWFGVAMALYGVVFAVLENDIRRLLGYHIISQVGYMVAAVGVGTDAAVNGATAHAFAHILYKGLLLMGVGAVIHATGRSKMTELGGLAHRMRPVLVLYMIGAVSISSFPLFSGFVSKELAVEATGAAGYGVAVVLLKIASVGTFLHTGLKLPYGTWFGGHGPGSRTDAGQGVPVGPVPPSMYVAMGLSAALNLAIGVFPALLYDLLPYPVEHSVYTVGKVAETGQLLLFTALASWLLIDRLGAVATISLDADWPYRQLAGRLADRHQRAPEPSPGAPPSPAPAPAGRLVAVRSRARQRLATRTYATPPPVPATWQLGVVVLVAATMFLAAALVAP